MRRNGEQFTKGIPPGGLLFVLGGLIGAEVFIAAGCWGKFSWGLQRIPVGHDIRSDVEFAQNQRGAVGLLAFGKLGFYSVKSTLTLTGGAGT